MTNPEEVYRITLSSWTAGFRYPNLISGFQPSLVVPPLSTLYGLISAATGTYCSAKDFPLGYVFRFHAQAIELETIYQVTSKESSLKTKSNVIRRQILFDNTLWLYVSEPSIASAFYDPYYQLVLGRSSDLATVDEIKQIQLIESDKLTSLRGTVVPFGAVPLGAPIQALPTSFSNEIPRKSLGTRPFFLLDYYFQQTNPIYAKGFFDSEMEHQIYWHDYMADIE